MIIIPEIKLTFKNLIKIISVCCLFMVTGYLVVYWYVLEISSHYHRDEVELVKKEVESGLDYPSNFEQIMDKIRPSEKYIKTKSFFHDSVFSSIIGMNLLPRAKYRYTYYSENVFEIIDDKQLRKQKWANLLDKKMLFAIGLEKELSAKEIEAFYFLNKTVNLKVDDDEYKRLTGLQEVSLERFGKTVKGLSTKELIELFVLMDSSGAFYQEDKERLNFRIRMFESLLERL